MTAVDRPQSMARTRVRKAERREQILLELKLRPHVRVSELADRFGVSGETVRRDMDELSGAGLINRAHGGASAAAHGNYPGLDERSRARFTQRERIGRAAAKLVQPGETAMIDSGSTTLQLARFLAYAGTSCTVITNSLPVAMALGQSAEISVILCPGDYIASEAAVVGPEATEFLARHNVDRCLIGAAGFTTEGPSETVRGFAAIKRVMLRQSANRHLLVDGEKFGKRGLFQVGGLETITSVVVDRAPSPIVKTALENAEVGVLVAPRSAAE